jgi:molybdopterin-guanine dinucleotide biosynthesis protein A
LSTDPFVAIIAGGKSKRMGADKTALKWRAKTLLENIAEQAFMTNLQVLVVGQIQPLNWPFPDVVFIEDPKGDLGPIGGLESALAHAKGADVMAIAADMPLIDTSAMNWLVGQSSQCECTHGLVVRSRSGIEPLFSLYRSRALSLIRQRISEEKLSLQQMIAAGAFCTIDASERIDPLLFNVNTPEDWQRLLSMGD